MDDTIQSACWVLGTVLGALVAVVGILSFALLRCVSRVAELTQMNHIRELGEPTPQSSLLAIRELANSKPWNKARSQQEPASLPPNPTASEGATRTYKY